MATASTKTICVCCKKEKLTYACQGCLKNYCLSHLNEHRKDLDQQLDEIENHHDEFRQNLQEQRSSTNKHPLIREIDQWKRESIEKIKQTAEQCREQLISCATTSLLGIEKKLNQLAEQIKDMRNENEFNEIDLNDLKSRIQKLQEELVRPANVSIEQQSKTSFINSISVLTLFQRDTRWKQVGMTIAGGEGQGNQLSQLSHPNNMCIDGNDQTVYVADLGNARIVKWTANAKTGQIVAGGSRTHPLSNPTAVIIDREDNSLIIADMGNRRVIRWSGENNSDEQIIASNIDCRGLAMHKDGSLYVLDHKKNEVRRWKRGEENGMIVAGGNEKGRRLNQLNTPRGIFVDDAHTLYISDGGNHRVMKWLEDAKEGIVVAGGNGEGNSETQLSSPDGLFIDQFRQIYVADAGNNRVMRWCEGAKEGTIVIDSNQQRRTTDRLNRPVGLSLDRTGNLYVVDCKNHRIQKFLIDYNQMFQ